MSSESQVVDLTVVKTEPDDMETNTPQNKPGLDIATSNGHSSAQLVGETPETDPLTESTKGKKGSTSTSVNETDNSSVDMDTVGTSGSETVVTNDTPVNIVEVAPNDTEMIPSLEKTDSGADGKPGDAEAVVSGTTPAGTETAAGTETGDGEDDDCVLMEYRSATNVTVVNGTSDSSGDSSSSESEVEETTDAKLNKALSHERDASPEGERRVKLNRHGFEDIRTKGEILPEELPPLEELTITVDETVKMEPIGTIKSIVGVLVVIASNTNISPLDDDSILFVDGHKVLGQVFETFGPVKSPWYSVRFNDSENITSKGLTVGMPVYCAPNEESFTKYVFVNALKEMKGSDASWDDNNEPPEKYLDYSDDESERAAKAKRKNKNKKDREQTDCTESGPEKRGRNSHCWPPREQRSANDQPGSWAPRNPFQGNNRPINRSRFEGRPHPGNGPRGPPWNQTRFNGPPPRFSGPPNFQGRPNFRNQQFPQHFPQMGNGQHCNNTQSEMCNNQNMGGNPNQNMGGNPRQTYNNGTNMRVNLQSPPPPAFGSSLPDRTCPQPSSSMNGQPSVFGSQFTAPNTAVPPPAFGSNVGPPINRQCNIQPQFPTNQQRPVMENRVNSSAFTNNQSRPQLANGVSQYGSQTNAATEANMNNPSFQNVANTGMQSVPRSAAPPKRYQVHALNPTNQGQMGNPNSNPQPYEQIQVSAATGPYRPVAQQQGNYPSMQQGTGGQSGVPPYRGTTHPIQPPTFVDNRNPAQNMNVNSHPQNYQNINNTNHHNQRNTGGMYGSTAYGTTHGQGEYQGQEYQGQNTTGNIVLDPRYIQNS